MSLIALNTHINTIMNDEVNILTFLVRRFPKLKNKKIHDIRNIFNKSSIRKVFITFIKLFG